VKVVTRKRKRKAAKKPSSSVKKSVSSTTLESDQILKDNLVICEEDEPNRLDEKLSTTETIQPKTANIIQHMASSSTKPLPSLPPPEVLKILPSTTKISLVADLGKQLSKGIQDVDEIDDYSSKNKTFVDAAVNQKENIVNRMMKQRPENPEPKIVQRVSAHECNLCDARFTTKSRLSEHIGASHNYKCGHCKKNFQSIGHLKNHLQLPHVLVCGMCPKTKFVTGEDLTSHMLEIHFSCNLCKVTFNSNVGIEEHMSAFHSSCEVCENFFHWAEPGHTCFYTRSNTRPRAYKLY